MELIERYLQAVRFWLPAEHKQDIIAELSEDLHAQIEEQEASLGRTLSEPEVEAILKRSGRPVLVANRFLPQEHLIGPVLFPIYRFVLKIVLLVYLAPWVLTWLGLMIYKPGYRVDQLSHWMASAASAWSRLWFTALIAVGTVTVIFAILERVQAKSHFLEKWDPRKLPPLRNPTLIPRSTSMFETGATLFALIWWPIYMHSSTIGLGPDVRISLSASWPWFFWGVLALIAATGTLAAVNLARPYWTGPRATVRLLLDCAGSALFCLMLKANIVAGMSIASVPTERALEIANEVDLWMSKMLPVAIALGVAIAGADIYRLLRVKSIAVNPPLEVLANL